VDPRVITLLQPAEFDYKMHFDGFIDLHQLPASGGKRLSHIPNRTSIFESQRSGVHFGDTISGNLLQLGSITRSCICSQRSSARNQILCVVTQNEVLRFISQDWRHERFGQGSKLQSAGALNCICCNGVDSDTIALYLLALDVSPRVVGVVVGILQ
jgi:hypothetical protein